MNDSIANGVDPISCVCVCVVLCHISFNLAFAHTTRDHSISHQQRTKFSLLEREAY